MVRPIDASSQHHRRSLRLTGYDYRQAGAYFVTICVQSPSVSLGKIDGSSVILSPAGKLIETIWFELPLRFTGLVLDEFIVMPDHIHGILVLTGVCDVNTSSRRLGDVVGAFKSISTHEYVLRVREAGWPPFEGRLWQRNYYEHVVRSDAALAAIRRYIEENPARGAVNAEEEFRMFSAPMANGRKG